jgi:riboflavin biosynthesis pyrimidine reductase
MSADERQAAIRDLVRAASNAFAVLGNSALDDDPRLASRILMFREGGARVRVIVDTAAAEPKITGELVRDVDGERLTIFELLAAPAEASGDLH